MFYAKILLYLKKRGIKRIDYLIISHGDSDHNYMLKDLIKFNTIKDKENKEILDYIENYLLIIS